MPTLTALIQSYGCRSLLGDGVLNAVDTDGIVGPARVEVEAVLGPGEARATKLLFRVGFIVLH